MLDALHTNQQTLSDHHPGARADFLLPVKDNHEALRKAAEQSMPARPAPPPGPACQPRYRDLATPATAGAFPPVPWRCHPAVRYRRSEETNCGRLEQRSVRWSPRRRKVSAASRRTRWWRSPRGDLPQRKVPRQAHLGDRAYVSSLPMTPANALALLLLIRSYWRLSRSPSASGCHRKGRLKPRTQSQQPAGARHRARVAMGFYQAWRRRKKQTPVNP